MPAGIQCHDSAPVLDDTVLSLDARTLDGDVLRHAGVLSPNTGDSCDTAKTREECVNTRSAHFLRTRRGSLNAGLTDFPTLDLVPVLYTFPSETHNYNGKTNSISERIPSLRKTSTKTWMKKNASQIFIRLQEGSYYVTITTF